MTRTPDDAPGYSLASWLLLALSAAMPVVALTGFSNFERGRHAALVLGAALLLIVWALGVMRRRGAQVSAVGVAGLGVAFFGLAGASFLWSSAPVFGVLSASMWVALGALVWVVLAPVGRAIAFEDWSLAVAIGVIGAGALGLYELVGGTLLTPVWDAPGIAGGFDALEFAAAYYVVALPVICGALALGGRGRVRRGVWIAALVLGTAHLAMVARPLDLVIVIVAGALALLVGQAARRRCEGGGRPGLKHLAWPVMVIVAGAALGLGFVERPESSNEATDLPRVRPDLDDIDDLAADSDVRWPYFAIDRSEELRDGTYRPYLNAITRGLYTQQPVIGHGAGGWWLQQSDVIHDGDDYVRAEYSTYAVFKSPHSDFARISVEQGGLGVALWSLWLLGILALVAAAVRRGQLTEDQRAAMVGLTFGFVAGIAMMFRAPVLELGSSAVVWTVGAALLARSAAEWTESGPLAAEVTLGRESLARRALLAAVAAIVGAAMIGPNALNTLASKERGHADILMLRTHFEDAIAQYEEAHNYYPAHAEVLYNQSLAHTLIGQARQGEPLIAEALEIRPYDSRFLSQGSFIALALQRLDTALERGREAIRTGPNNLQAVDAYVAALQRRGRFEEAAAIMVATIERGVPTREAGTLHARLGQVYDASLDRPLRALEHYQKAAATLSDGPERMMVVNRRNELEKRLQRDRLIREGKAVPRHLLPEEALEQGHDHGHDHGGAPGPTGPPGMPPLPDAHEGHNH